MADSACDLQFLAKNSVQKNCFRELDRDAQFVGKTQGSGKAESRSGT
jgi:hypothetical protein